MIIRIQTETLPVIDKINAIYHEKGEALDNGSYGSCITIRTKIAWLLNKKLITQKEADSFAMGE